MIGTKVCRVCGTKLNKENWYPSLQKGNRHICIKCVKKYGSVWKKANRDKADAANLKERRRRGVQSFNENKECAQFLGCHVAERVLSHVFNDVEVMPHNNPGYDFICNKGKKIDAKSSCIRRNSKGWMFNIKHNTTADYFLCLAFDNREDLNPLHVWLIPGSKFSHLTGIGITPSTIHKWDEYRINLTKILDCCNEIR